MQKVYVWNGTYEGSDVNARRSCTSIVLISLPDYSDARMQEHREEILWASEHYQKLPQRSLICSTEWQMPGIDWLVWVLNEAATCTRRRHSILQRGNLLPVLARRDWPARRWQMPAVFLAGQ